MTGFAFDLPTVWALLVAFAVLTYVLLDGFDLGVGLLFPWIGDGEERDLAMNSIAPVWDGNETWLVLGGGGLFAVFPLAFAIVMPALYAPLIAMLTGLIFRGVAFEFRWRGERGRPWWDRGFFLGSLAATLAQGIALGALVQGIEVEGRAYAGGWWDWATPFSLLTAIALVVGYALLGATWLVMKTEGRLHDRALAAARPLAFATLASIAAVSAWTAFLDPVYMQRWLAWPALLYSAPMPIATGLAGWLLIQGLAAGRDVRPFLAAQSIFVLCFVGLGIGFYPYILPHDVTIHDAAAPDSSLIFLLVGAAVLIPLILAYTAHAYWVFRGKVDPRAGYH
ncbi:MAG: cytochrome d ubiquinol oxidase subunit II [Geminicoccaceae bacterium]|nr:cytochrome d ubiquinol oxidase subunit II [Geminicoccaceae bacterium]